MKILVLGDSCLDRYVEGEVKRVNPEAPTPLLNLSGTVTENPGMAGNVYRALQALAEPSWQLDFMTDRNTSVKTRYVDRTSGYILLRTDENDRSTTTAECSQVPDYDVYVISDYSKGFVDKSLIQCLAKRGKVFIDSKLVFGSWAKDIFCVKINNKEYQHNLSNDGDLNYLQNLVVTKGGDGADYYQFGGRRGTYPGRKVAVRDVAGAGDVSLAALVAEYIRTESFPKAIEYANKAAAVAVSKPGVALVTKDEIQ